jgi:hypothetical protein
VIELPLAVGPVLPAEKNLVLLAGDGYVAGYWLASLFIADASEILSDQVSREELKKLALGAEKERRRVGCVLVSVLALVWIVGYLVDPDSYLLIPADRDLFGAIPMFGIGAFAAALIAPVAARRVVAKAPGKSRPQAEYRYGETRGRMWGLVLAAIYFGVWLCA